MGLRVIVAFAFLAVASSLRESFRKPKSIVSDLAALERFASQPTLDPIKDIDDEDESKEVKDASALLNVTDLAEKQPQGPTILPHAIFIPYGKNVPQVPGQRYSVVNSQMECTLCKKMIKNANDLGYDFPIASRRIEPEFEQMATAMAKVLQACPEFMNKWCYQDLGGSQKLRGPCPEHLVCHYCLGLNPLMCV